MPNSIMDDLLQIITDDEIVENIPIENDTSIKNFKPAKDDEDIKDRISNRQQREEFTRQILLMMACEVFFIALLLTGIFIVPYINALSPKIQINLPPIFYTSSLIVGMIVTYKYLDHVPPISIMSNKIEIKKIFKFVCIIGVLVLMNTMERHPYTLYIQSIVMSDTIINIILWACVSVFVKTTVLAGLIISGLYEDLKIKKKQ